MNKINRRTFLTTAAAGAAGSDVKLASSDALSTGTGYWIKSLTAPVGDKLTVAGTATVGEDYFWGWHDGSWDGKPNAGVVEFENAPDARMIILTADGQMDGQKLKLGATYHTQSEFRRRYSVMAVSKKP